MPTVGDALVIPFVAFGADGTPATALTSFTVTLLKPDNVTAVGSVAVTEVGGGLYSAAKAATTFDIAGAWTMRVTHATAQTAFVVIDVSAAAGSTLTAEQVRIEMDANSTKLALIGSAAATVASPVTTGGNVTLFAGSTYGITTQTVVVTSATPMTLTGTPKFEIPDLDVVLDGVLTGSAGAWVLTFSFTGAQTATLQLGTRRYRVRVALTGGNLTPALIEGTVIVR